MNGGLTQVMVNPENLFFFKKAANGLVDGAVRCEVVTQRFFENYPGMGRVQTGGSELFAHGGK